MADTYYRFPTRYSALKTDAIVKIGYGWTYWVWNEKERIWVKDESYAKEHEDGHLMRITLKEALVFGIEP
jgi:hypothetical protein